MTHNNQSIVKKILSIHKSHQKTRNPLNKIYKILVNSHKIPQRLSHHDDNLSVADSQISQQQKIVDYHQYPA